MNLKSVHLLFVLVVLLGFQQVILTTLSISDDHRQCGFLNEEEDLCASYCYNPLKLALGYIVELKEKNKELEQSHSDKYNDRLSGASQKEIDTLKKEIQQLKENLEHLNNFQRQAAKDKDESIAEQNILKSKIERILTDKKDEKDEKEMQRAKDDKIQIETKLKLETENVRLKVHLDEETKKLESQKKQLEDYQAKEMEYSKEINELNSKVLSLEKVFRDRFSKNGCKGLSSGIHKIDIPGVDLISAVCEGNIEGGGWIVIHKRFDGSVNFRRNWSEYRNGFGHMDGEFFIGLENLHRITNSKTYELYVQLGYYDGRILFASYDNFKIGDEGKNYRLDSLGKFRGTAPNKMDYNVHNPFSTIDRENARLPHCASYLSGWWHNACSNAALNGKYERKTGCDYDVMSWSCVSLKSAQMLIRPK
ncbi:fibrinogen-like protein 1 [Drosophila willistoni]|uniref:fibrinogen-like protein 1 n=1 Tax=Drosophila willistoni TaxID=7260 RepID=UPI000C26C30F|nr:fibrinogen-like protein 1 [Drosophila willistoni]